MEGGGGKSGSRAMIAVAQCGQTGDDAKQWGSVCVWWYRINGNCRCSRSGRKKKGWSQRRFSCVSPVSLIRCWWHLLNGEDEGGQGLGEISLIW